jgi:hypothetical protein
VRLHFAFEGFWVPGRSFLVAFKAIKGSRLRIIFVIEQSEGAFWPEDGSQTESWP